MSDPHLSELKRPVTKSECSLLNQETRALIKGVAEQAQHNGEILGQIDVAIRGKREGDSPGLNERVAYNSRVIGQYVSDRIPEKVDEHEHAIVNLEANSFPWKHIIVAVICGLLVSFSIFTISLFTGFVEISPQSAETPFRQTKNTEP